LPEVKKILLSINVVWNIFITPEYRLKEREYAFNTAGDGNHAGEAMIRMI